ncbi:MAG: sigma factor [Candidatus Saccharimonadales bacterium]
MANQEELILVDNPDAGLIKEAGQVAVSLNPDVIVDVDGNSQTEQSLLIVDQMLAEFKDHPEVVRRRPVVIHRLSDSIFEDFYAAQKEWPLLKPEEEIILKDKIDKGVSAFLIISSGQALHQETQDLIDAAVEGTDAYLKFLEGNIGLVYAWVMRHRSIIEAPKEDLLSAGLQGLRVAIVKFDQRKGIKFSTYASWWIRQSIQREYPKHSPLYPVPHGVHNRFIILRQVYEEFISSQGRPPTEPELTERGIDPELVEIENTRRLSTSLEVPITDDRTNTRADVVADHENGFGEVEDEIVRESLIYQMINQSELTLREQVVLCLRFGLPLSYIAELPEELHKLQSQTSPDPASYKAVVILTGLTYRKVKESATMAIQKLKTKWGANVDIGSIFS